jgi:hypothetical protein
MRADVGNGKRGAELRDEDRDGHDRIMPASVAPAEDADLFLLQFAEDGGAAAAFFFLEMSLFHAPHAVFVLSLSVPGPSHSCP